MKMLTACIIVLVVMGISNITQAKTLEEYITEAEDYQKSGNLEQALILMEEAVEKYPDSSNAYVYSGLYAGMQAGQSQDYMEAGRLIEKSFTLFDRAVALDSLNPFAHFYRGLMGVNVPEFLGKLEGGIYNLEFLIRINEDSPEKVSDDIIISAYDLLGMGYKKKGEKENAKLAWEKVLELAPGTELAESAEENINRLFPEATKESQSTEEKKIEGPTITMLKEKIEKEPDNPSLLLDLGKAYINVENYKKAEEALKKSISIDSSNVETYKYLAFALGGIAGKGYDERIYDNTNFLANIAFGVMQTLDRAFLLAPDDIELRLLRGIVGVQMPFFVGKLEQGIDDLNIVIESDVHDSTKAEALYWLGAAYQKKAMTYWIDVVSRYSDSRAAQLVFDGICPSVKHVDLLNYQTPFLVIDFVLGFRDELAPQTGVWIEDEKNNFIKTIYVSGFSGFAKEKQINLPQWSSSSEFADVDAVTEASIDLGHHIYVWDFKDNSGKEVKQGNYIIKVEVSYWPSMKYQSVSAPIKLGKKEERTVVEEGNLIPYLEVKYFP